MRSSGLVEIPDDFDETVEDACRMVVNRPDGWENYVNGNGGLNPEEITRRKQEQLQLELMKKVLYTMTGF